MNKHKEIQLDIQVSHDSDKVTIILGNYKINLTHAERNKLFFLLKNSRNIHRNNKRKFKKLQRDLTDCGIDINKARFNS